MRFFPLAALLLAACSPEAVPTPAFADGNYAGAGRNRLCIARNGQRAGFIAYGSGDENCSASGRIEGRSLVPRGDAECRIPLEPAGEGIRIASLPAACAYYCAPGVSAAGSFTRRANAGPVTDFGGDPLC